MLAFHALPRVVGVLFVLQLGFAASLQAASELIERIRIRNFSEFMSPSFQGGTGAIPGSDGKGLAPSLMTGFFWADFEVSPNYKILYFQRNTLTFSNFGGASEFQLKLQDPRFGLRRTQLFDVPGLITQYDFYVQPGVTAESRARGRQFDLGVRTFNRYSFQGSRFSIGAVTDVAFSRFDSGRDGADLSGTLVPFISYSISARVSTQHWFVLPFQHKSSGFSFDFPFMPLTQNGVNIDLSKTASVSLMLNHYLLVAPTLKNTWASLWVNFALL